MSSAAWKDLERRVCRALGSDRRPSIGRGGYARGTDDDGTAPFAVECKRTTRFQLRSAWIAQARQNAKSDGRPWLLVISEHRSQRPVAVLDFYALVQLAQEAGRLPELDIANNGEGDAMSVYEVPEPPTEPPPDEPAPDEPTPEGD